jgi:hypothetical protein
MPADEAAVVLDALKVEAQDPDQLRRRVGPQGRFFRGISSKA